VWYSQEHKAQNHENILSIAARTFREQGSESSGIGTVMKKVGLTKGGFYRHFESKDDLFVEAVARALDETGRAMEEVAKSGPEGQALRAIIERYLSVGSREFSRKRLRARRSGAGAGTETRSSTEKDRGVVGSLS
jgi:TetR/AcrR family transcriptional repressor of nem operon